VSRITFLDPNGTLVQPVLVNRPEDLHPVPDAHKAVAALNRAAMRCPVITVQSRIEKGLFTEAPFLSWFRDFAADMRTLGAYLEGPYVCPHRFATPCRCKKPNIHLYERAARDLALPVTGAFVVGDTADDMEAARRLGATGCLIWAGGSPHPQPAGAAFVAATLWEAAQWINGEDARRPHPNGRTFS